MGLEWRRHGNSLYGPYYIRRQGGRQYVGKGPLASQYAAEEQSRRAEEEARQSELKQLEALDTQVNELFGLTNAIMKGSLMADGFHQHHRGEWRKWRI